MRRNGWKGNAAVGLWMALLALCTLWNLSLYRFTGPADANPPWQVALQRPAGAVFVLLLGLGLVLAVRLRRRWLALAIAVYGWVEASAMLLLILCLAAGFYLPNLPPQMGEAAFAAVYLLWMVLDLTGTPLLAPWGGIFGGCCTGLAVALAATQCHARMKRRAEDGTGADKTKKGGKARGRRTECH